MVQSCSNYLGPEVGPISVTLHKKYLQENNLLKPSPVLPCARASEVPYRKMANWVLLGFVSHCQSQTYFAKIFGQQGWRMPSFQLSKGSVRMLVSFLPLRSILKKTSYLIAEAWFRIELRCLWVNLRSWSKKPNSVTELLYTDTVMNCLFRLTNYKWLHSCAQSSFDFHSWKAAYHLRIKYFLCVINAAYLSMLVILKWSKMLTVSKHINLHQWVVSNMYVKLRTTNCFSQFLQRLKKSQFTFYVWNSSRYCPVVIW